MPPEVPIMHCPVWKWITWWAIVEVLAVLILKDVNVLAAPATPTAVNITSISIYNVTVSVTLLPGRYDGVLVELYTDTEGSAVSSGSSPVSDFTLTSEEERSFTVGPLSPDLKPGQQYTVRVKSRSGSASSALSPVSAPAIVVLSPPTDVNITSISTSRVTVRVTLSAGRYNGVRVNVYKANENFHLLSVHFGRPVFTLTSAEQRPYSVRFGNRPLTPGQYYRVKAWSRFERWFSVSGVTSTVTLTPSTPTAFNITSISTDSVTVRVTLSAGRYDGVLVELYTDTGGSAVSSGSSPVSDFTLTSEEERSFTVGPLSPALTPGQHYTVTVKSRSRTEYSTTIDASTPATVTPSTPTAVNITSISTDNVTVSVTLSAGRYDGVLVELYTDTGGSAVAFGSSPVAEFTLTSEEERSFTVDPLSPALTLGHQYTVRVKSRSGSESSILSPISVPATVGAVSAVSITAISTDSVTVRVTLSAGRYDGVLVELYTDTEGSAVSSGSSPVSDFTLTSEEERSFTVGPLSPDLKPGQQYTVRVKSRSGSASSALSPVSAPAIVANGPSQTAGREEMLAMGVVIAVLVLTLCVVLVVCVIRRRRPQETARPNDLPLGNYETMKTMKANTDRTYESTNCASMVIPAARVTMSTNKLNKGKPDIFRGRLVLDGGDQRDVAIRKIKGTRPFERCKAEVNIMRNVGTHPNIVLFLGYCLKDAAVALMIHGFEYNGDLQIFLRQKRRSGTNTGLTETNLLRFAENVSHGMAHLAKLDILHGDLRAHNVLISGDLTAKISGLQHARPVGTDSRSQSKMGVPLCRWAALETLEERVYTPQSEVWSFGVLMWEIMTRGATPYGEMKTKEIRNLLLQNCRLACPKSCQVKLYNVMLECWKDDPEERPTFDLLSQRLAFMGMDIQQYMNIGIYESLDSVYEDVKDDNSG